MTQRIELFSSKHDAKNWNPSFLEYERLHLDLFSKYDAKNWTFFLRTWRKELNPSFLEYDALHLGPFFQNMTQKNWTIFWKFFWYDSKIWTHFVNMTQRIELFSDKTRRVELLFFFNTTQRIEHFWIRLKELNTLLIWLKELNSKRKTTQRIEPFLKKNTTQKCCFCEKKWLKELNSFFFGLRLKELNSFSDMTQRIETYFQYDSKYWIFQNKNYDSKNSYS